MHAARPVGGRHQLLPAPEGPHQDLTGAPSITNDPGLTDSSLDAGVLLATRLALEAPGISQFKVKPRMPATQ
jgi:hypothetical protein